MDRLCLFLQQVHQRGETFVNGVWFEGLVMASSMVRSVVLGFIGLLMQAPIGVASAQVSVQDNAPGETAVAKDSATSTSMKVQLTNAGASPVKVRRLNGKELEIAPKKAMAFTATALPLTLEFLPSPSVDQWVEVEFPKAGNYKYETTGETFSVTPVEPSAKTTEKKRNIGGNVAAANSGRGTVVCGTVVCGTVICGTVGRANTGRGNVRRGSLGRGSLGRGNSRRGTVGRGNSRRGNVGRGSLLRPRASATQCVCWCVSCCR